MWIFFTSIHINRENTHRPISCHALFQQLCQSARVNWIQDRFMLSVKRHQTAVQCIPWYSWLELCFLQSSYEHYIEENFSDSRRALQRCCQIDQILLISSVRLKNSASVKPPRKTGIDYSSCSTAPCHWQKARLLVLTWMQHLIWRTWTHTHTIYAPHGSMVIQMSINEQNSGSPGATSMMAVFHRECLLLPNNSVSFTTKLVSAVLSHCSTLKQTHQRARLSSL